MKPKKYHGGFTMKLYYNVTGGPVTTNNYGNVISPSRIDYKVI